MVKKLLLSLAALVVILALVVATRPAGYRVSRSLAMAAPPAVAYAQVADFHAWDKWSPWAKLDPAMKTTFGGQTGAVGSTYFWNGNDKVGEGRMTISAAAPAQRLEIKLEFMRPFASVNASDFTFAPEGGGTKVTWTMDGDKGGFVGKAFGLVMDFDKMIGADFEKGLAQLKAVSEAEAKKGAATASAPSAATGTAAPAAGATTAAPAGQHAAVPAGTTAPAK